MSEQYPLEKKQSQIQSLVQRVEDGPPLHFTRNGKTVAVLLSINDYEKIADRRKDFWELLMAFRKEVEEEGIEITDSDFEGLRDPSPGRNPAF